MNLSLDEYRALAAKALRGVGYSWGLAEDGAFAARRLAEFGLPTGPTLVRLMTRVDGTATAELMPGPEWMPVGDALCPVCVGTTIADLGECQDIVLGPTIEPILIAPFLAATISNDGVGYRIAWEGGQCQVTSDAMCLEGEIWSGPVSVRIAPGDATARRANRHDRVELDEATVDALTRFASRTYAPASEASRLAGAGAGADIDDE